MPEEIYVPLLQNINILLYYIAEYLYFVGGVHRFPAVNYLNTKTERLPVSSLDKTQNGIHVEVYPKVLRQRYDLTNSDVGSYHNNSQAVAQLLEQYYSNGDLSEFMTLFVGSDIPDLPSLGPIIL